MILMGKYSHGFRKHGKRYFIKQPGKRRRFGGKIIPKHIISGHEGERFVAQTFPELVQFENKRGFDFMTKDKKHFVEVKAIFPSTRKREELMLKVLNKKWMNEVADVVLIVTRKELFFCKADRLREFVEANLNSFFKFKKTKGDAIDRIMIPTKEMVSAGFLKKIERVNIKQKTLSFQSILDKLREPISYSEAFQRKQRLLAERAAEARQREKEILKKRAKALAEKAPKTRTEATAKKFFPLTMFQGRKRTR